jgi:hypothetical protein
MNQVIQQYITNAKSNGQDDLSIRNNLLSSGWTPDEVDAAFVATGSFSTVPSAGIGRTKANYYAKWALVLAGATLVLFFVWAPSTLLTTFAGIVVSIMGLRSSHKVMAISALLFFLLYSAFTALLAYTFLHVTNTQTWPFSNEPLTTEELLDFGLE